MTATRCVMFDFLKTPRDSVSATRRPPSSRGRRRGPLVSVLLPTHNRRRYLGEALASVLRQTHSHLEIFVVRDGGQEVTDVVDAFRDSRVIFIDRKENRGKPYSLNEALSQVRGKYITYLDDDDVYYPNHIETLVEALETQTDCQVAYSDLYKTYCAVLPGGSRVPLSKRVEISRDFDRFLMLYFNHVLHVSLMHRGELLDRTGLYNEDLTILIDWDMTRRLAFFSDFHHVRVITGEFYSPVGESDRISFQRRKDPEQYLRNLLAIRTTRPAKPWSKIGDLSIILLADRVSNRTADALLRIWRYTFYPYKLYVPLPPADISRLKVAMPNVEIIPVSSLSSAAERVDAAMQRAEGDYVAVVPENLAIGQMWVENPLYALINSAGREGFLPEGATPESWAAVLRRADLEHARRSHPRLSLEASLAASAIRTRRPQEEELPFQFDELLRQARLAEADGNWIAAARLFERMGERHQNVLWMKTMAACAYFEAGDRARAEVLSREVNRERPTVDTLLLEARMQRRKGDFDAAIHLLGRAEQLLGPDPTSRAHPAGDLCSTQGESFQR